MLIELMAASLLAASNDPEGVVTTAPRDGLQAVPAASAAALAETLSDASPAVTLQSAAPHGLTTEDQIARWIGERKAVGPAAEAWADPWEEAGPRRMHGQVSAGMGSGGYRDFAATVALPIGESGTLNLSVSQTKNAPWAYPYGYGYGYGYGYPYGYGHGLGGYGWRDAYGAVGGPLGVRGRFDQPSRIRPFSLDDERRETSPEAKNDVSR